MRWRRSLLVLAAVAMIACAIILGNVEDDLSMQSVMLDTVADAAAAVGVAITGAIILLAGGLYWLDSLVALAIALVVGYHALRLVRKAIAELRGQRSTAVSFDSRRHAPRTARRPDRHGA